MDMVMSAKRGERAAAATEHTEHRSDNVRMPATSSASVDEVVSAALAGFEERIVTAIMERLSVLKLEKAVATPLPKSTKQPKAKRFRRGTKALAEQTMKVVVAIAGHSEGVTRQDVARETGLPGEKMGVLLRKAVASGLVAMTGARGGAKYYPKAALPKKHPAD